MTEKLSFQCEIRGENFPGQIIGKKELVGFYTTRWVEATSDEEAEIMALEMLRTEAIFEVRSEKLWQKAEAKVYFEKIVPIQRTKRKLVNSGATWFEME